MSAIDLFRAGKAINTLAHGFPFPFSQWANAPVVDISNVYRLYHDCPLLTDSRSPWTLFTTFFRDHSNDETLCACIYLNLFSPGAVRAMNDANRGFLVHQLVDDFKADSALNVSVFFAYQGKLLTAADVLIPFQGHSLAPDNNGVPAFFDPDLSDHGRDMAGEAAYCAVAACAFANCQNVTLETVKPSRQVRRHAERHNLPVYEHHILKLDGHAHVQRHPDAASTAPGAVKPLHLARGHFAHYGPKYGTGKLFGRTEGKFWIPPHVRGSLDAGIVTKDYEVG